MAANRRREERGGRTAARRVCLPAAVLSTLLGLAAAASAQAIETAPAVDLPDAPSALLARIDRKDDASSEDVEVRGIRGVRGVPGVRGVRGADAGLGEACLGGPTATTPKQLNQQQSAGRAAAIRRHGLLPCPDQTATPKPGTPAPLQGPPPCQKENPIQLIVSAPNVQPLTSKQKGLLAFRDFIDPFNFATVATYSAVAIGANSHSAYGPGLKGFGLLTGYSLATDARDEFLETYAIASLVHEDPRYHRLPHARFRRRVWHAIEHTYVSQHDDGRPMPNYATLLTYPIGAEISDRYVPGIQTDLPSTGKRVAIGLATDPAGALVAEFLPDVARRIHIHVVFVQEILNRMITGPPKVQ